MTFSFHNDQSKYCLMAQRVVSRGFLWPVCVEESRQVFALKVPVGAKINVSELRVREKYDRHGQ